MRKKNSINFGGYVHVPQQNYQEFQQPQKSPLTRILGVDEDGLSKEMDRFFHGDEKQQEQLLNDERVKQVNIPNSNPQVYDNSTQSIDFERYTREFSEFTAENPTTFHVAAYFAHKLKRACFKELSEYDYNWKLERGGNYFVTRNGSAIIAFSIGENYEPKDADAMAIIASHMDVLTAKLKPVSVKPTVAGCELLGVAPYAGALGPVWWDRDLGVAGRVFTKKPAKSLTSSVGPTIGDCSDACRSTNAAFDMRYGSNSHFCSADDHRNGIKNDMTFRANNGNDDSCHYRQSVKHAFSKPTSCHCSHSKCANDHESTNAAKCDKGPFEIQQVLVKLDWPIARIPSLAPHFGVGSMGHNNKETEAVPVIGLSDGTLSSENDVNNFIPPAGSGLLLGARGNFSSTQPPRLVKLIAEKLGLKNPQEEILNWELELFDTQPPQLGGLEKELLFCPRLDDRLCSWAAVQALIETSNSKSSSKRQLNHSQQSDKIIKIFAGFDDEEVGSLQRQGGGGNFLQSIIHRILESLAPSSTNMSNFLGASMARSMMLSADVTHAINPNFVADHLPYHAPRLNVGIAVAADSNGHMATDSASTAFIQRIAEISGSTLQVLQIRNDRRSGSTIGPMLSSSIGLKTIDLGIPQLSMHSIRATTGAKDIGHGTHLFRNFYDHFQTVNKEFRF